MSARRSVRSRVSRREAGTPVAFDRAELLRILADGLESIGLRLEQGQVEQMLTVVEQLMRWNRTYNLTSIRDPVAIITHHLLDSASIVPLIASMFPKKRLTILDVGAGAGLPGLVLAIAASGAAGAAVDSSAVRLPDRAHAAPGGAGGVPGCPARGPGGAADTAAEFPTDARPEAAVAQAGALGAGIPLMPGRPLARWELTLLDAVEKKVSFQRHVIGLLGLDNARAVHSRVEDLRAPAYDLIASRAFASLAQFVASTRHLLAPAGCWLAMKGARPDAEIAALAEDVGVDAVLPLTVPGLDAHRHLIVLRPEPRAASVALRSAGASLDRGPE